MRALLPALLVSLLAIAVTAVPLAEDRNNVYELLAELALRQYELTHPQEPQNLIVTAIKHAYQTKSLQVIFYGLEFVAMPPHSDGIEWDCKANVKEVTLTSTYVVENVSCKVNAVH